MLNRFTADYLETLSNADFVAKPKVSGRLASFDGLLMEAVGLTLPVGTVCQVGEGAASVEAEVIGFRNGRTLMMNLGGAAALLPRAPVKPIGAPGEAEVGPALLGRVVDGAGKPIDGLGPIRGAGRWPLAGKLQSPLDRGRVREPLDVGVRAINGLLTIGQGQRVGIMAGSGVGKSVLLGMIVRAAQADVIVIGLIGERSREVADFLETKVAGEARKRSVVVAVPANHSPVLRIRGALRAHAIAEAFRDEGKKVLLIMDSLTRVAHAGREIGLALGEPASARGYPPSAIAMLPNLIERAGVDVHTGGSITAIYTVLADGDDGNDPVVDSARSILDGHIVLNRQLAERGVYPAIDIGPSVSRVMTDIVDAPHAAAARTLRRHLATYEENRDLVLMGAYRHGADPAIDAAIACHPAVMEYIRQDADENVSLDDAVAELTGVFGG
ncbi:flagellum-specific ATP synthase [Sphingomonas sp. PP-F2F-G114-C0414]|uniref:FliI/YscN family ATPase n=1 Tax=Sphingomonas sp. PP-F2F-G114-C0414 TaxID=2135662 RepID=UPI000EF928CF|nr:FliI/YscN family ATPase [Sphingomonas sp. PP-F2F-G114-C0414]RMB34633.1 flagellum-specific ATP synthase [Sphingomonas sp. PP-F2F-G114-C0414]